MQDFSNKQMVFGIIDRLIVTDSEVWVIDYKTHRISQQSHVADLIKQYQPQLEYYCQGATRMWPDKRTRGCLLLTHQKELVEINLQSSAYN